MCFVKWYGERIAAVRKLPLRDFFLFFLGKVLGSFALGLLVASYVKGIDWIMAGWVFLLVAVLVSLPAVPKILK